MNDTPDSPLIDLHSHSTRSDGAFSPTRLMQEAASRGVNTLALTDHDTTAGLDEAEEAARENGVDFVPGVEITCECAGTEVHLLGLGVDRLNHILLQVCGDVQLRRRKRFFAMVEKLRAHGVPLSTETVEDGVSLARPYLARLMVQQGKVKTYQEAFQRYLRKGLPGFVEHTRIPISRAIEAIQTAGGVAVLAHPGLYRNGDECVYEGARLGMDGIECFHSDHDHNTSQHFVGRARKLSLLISGGADFHGPEHPRSKFFGKRGCPPAEFERMQDVLAARAN
ncbi:MAG: PHP domain-containing protein [Planctomycetes bacterium]|nr:PHP domain-containing protein [Planctomycetota bacterium]